MAAAKPREVAYSHQVSRPRVPPPSATTNAPPATLSPLDDMPAPALRAYLRALTAESFAKRFRGPLVRLMENSLNGGTFNAPVNALEQGIPDYDRFVKRPMDLGTVRQKLEAGRYSRAEELAADVVLTFDNAMAFNPAGHAVHVAASRLKDEFLLDFKRLTAKRDHDARRKDAHACGFCQGQLCRLCGDKCLRFDPNNLHCDW